MKTKLYFLLTFLIASISFSVALAQDTFSICAVDSATGQVGSAGATCIASSSVSAIIISDVHPGVGVIHTQAYWYAANQNYGKSLMNLKSLTPRQIIDSLTRHDYLNDSTRRQYGVVDLVGGGRSAGFTGANTDNYKNHITGPNYSIQGNILLGQQVLDSMEARFLRTPGSLACRLMAAMQGAKMIGADTRCTGYGISSFSAFIRVANPGDTLGTLYLDESVNTFQDGKEPIDSLQTVFNQWGGSCATAAVSSLSKDQGISIFPNPTGTLFTVYGLQFTVRSTLEVYNIIGERVFTRQFTVGNRQSEMQFDVTALPAGIYFIRIVGDDTLWTGKFIKE